MSNVQPLTHLSEAAIRARLQGGAPAAGLTGRRRALSLRPLPCEGLREHNERPARFSIINRQKCLYEANPFLRVRTVGSRLVPELPRIAGVILVGLSPRHATRHFSCFRCPPRSKGIFTRLTEILNRASKRKRAARVPLLSPQTPVPSPQRRFPAAFSLRIPPAPNARQAASRRSRP